MRVELRKWNPSYAEDLQKAADNVKIAAKMLDAFPSPYTLADAQEYIAQCRERNDSVAFYRAIVIDGKAVGAISATRGNDIHSCAAEIGYFLAEPYWGNGIMTGVVRAVCAEIFRQMDVVRIYAVPFASNAAARKVLEKSGFKLESIMRNSYIKHGAIGDLCLYALLKK